MTKTITLNMGLMIDIEFDDGYLSQELMNVYEECFHEVSNDRDFDEFETQLDKHKANITYALLRGHTDFIEGYGKVSNFVKKYDVILMEANKERE